MTEHDACDLWARLNDGQNLRKIPGWGRIAQAICVAVQERIAALEKENESLRRFKAGVDESPRLF